MISAGLRRPMGMAIVRLRGPLQQRAGGADHAVTGTTVAAALRRLASARATGDRHGLRRELGEVAASALRWRDRL